MLLRMLIDAKHDVKESVATEWLIHYTKTFIDMDQTVSM